MAVEGDFENVSAGTIYFNTDGIAFNGVSFVQIHIFAQKLALMFWQ